MKTRAAGPGWESGCRVGWGGSQDGQLAESALFTELKAQKGLERCRGNTRGLS